MEQKQNPKLDLVKISKKMKRKSRVQKALEEVRQSVNKLGDVSDLHDDQDFIQLLCNYVENIDKIQLKGEEKHGIVVDLLKEYFPQLNNEKDISRIKKTIDSIVENGLVKKVAKSTVVKKTLFSCLSKIVFG